MTNTEAKNRKRRAGFLFWSGLALIILVAGMVFYHSNDQDMNDGESLIRPVKLHRVGDETTLGVRHFIGRVDAVHTLDLSFQVGGHIARVPVQQGSLIAAGELIAELDADEYRLAAREAELQLEQARRDQERNRSLFERGAIPQAQMDQLQTTLELRQVALDTARRNLAHTRITAPFDALITRRLLDPHTNVQPHVPVVRVQNVEELWVHINVPEHLMASASDPEEFIAQAIFANQPDTPITLSYREHETEPDAVAQTYKVTFAMPRPDNGNVLPGMTVTVMLMPADIPESDARPIPVSALDSDSNGDFRVWVFDVQNQQVNPRTVQVLGMANDNKAIVTGLETSEQIVSTGTQLLLDGMQVRPFKDF